MEKIIERSPEFREESLISYFKNKGIRGWRRKTKIAGRPDFAFPKIRTVLFIDSCITRGHNCSCCPARMEEFWEEEIIKNRFSDKQTDIELKRKKWKVLRIWDCEIHDPVRLDEKFEVLAGLLDKAGI
ncbi:MAG: hypothetical protein ACOC2K_02590 [Bacteroidota bacterium]